MLNFYIGCGERELFSFLISPSDPVPGKASIWERKELHLPSFYFTLYGLVSYHISALVAAENRVSGLAFAPPAGQFRMGENGMKKFLINALYWKDLVERITHFIFFPDNRRHRNLNVSNARHLMSSSRAVFHSKGNHIEYLEFVSFLLLISRFICLFVIYI